MVRAVENKLLNSIETIRSGIAQRIAEGRYTQEQVESAAKNLDVTEEILDSIRYAVNYGLKVGVVNSDEKETFDSFTVSVEVFNALDYATKATVNQFTNRLAQILPLLEIREVLRSLSRAA